MRSTARLLLASLLLALAPGAAPAAELIDGIAAQVGNEIVLISDVMQRAAPVEAQMRQAGAPPEQIVEMRAEVLESLIERALISQLVRRAELEATPQEIDDAIEVIAKENGITLEQLRQSVESQGMSFDVYRDRIRGELEQSKVLNGMVASRVEVDDAEVLALYAEEFGDQPMGGEQIRLRHLLIPAQDKPAARAEACERAGAARARIVAGAEFDAVAREVSPVSPELGWLHASELAGWMAPHVMPLEADGLTGVIETDFGCNVLQVVERRSWTAVSFDQAEPVLRQRLFQQRMRDEYLAFTQRLRDRTFIQRKGYFAQNSRLPTPEPVGTAP